MAVERTSLLFFLKRAQGNEQMERLAGAAAVQVQVGEIRPAFDGVRDGGPGLLRCFALALHATASQAFGAGLVLPALNGSMAGIGRDFGDLAQAHMVTHALEPIGFQELEQSLFATMQSQPIADGAWVQAVIGETDPDVVQPLLHEGQMQAVVERTQQLRRACLRIRKNPDIEIVAGHVTCPVRQTRRRGSRWR